MSEIVTTPMSGFVELLPEKQVAFNRMLDTIRQTYERSGFIPLDTPVLERAEVLLAKAGGETEKQIYRFTKGSSDIAMRFDLTVPLARYVANNAGRLTFPFRRYAIGKVYRGERPQAGRFREFYQADIDIVGNEALDIRYDAEVPSVIYTVFSELGFSDFTIRINNRKILNGLFAHLGIGENAPVAMQAIDKLEKVGVKAVEEDLLSKGFSPEAVSELVKVLCVAERGTVAEGASDMIAQLTALDVSNEQFLAGLSELATVVELLSAFGVPEKNFTVDLTIARGLDYYTGTVYETKLNQYPEVGSVCSGGRYDDLAGFFTKQTLPGVGISIGLTRLFDQLDARGLIEPAPATLTRVLIVPMIDDVVSAVELAAALRSKGVATEISFSKAKVKKRLKYADCLRIPYVVFIGEDELSRGNYTVRNMQTGEQRSLPVGELVDMLTSE